MVLAYPNQVFGLSELWFRLIRIKFLDYPNYGLGLSELSSKNAQLFPLLPLRPL
jgi:hypothetical protein